jgi:glycosyltransferase involved in cell wall biosynthesis
MNKKIAIIHDVFIEAGGAERVVLALLEMFPDADVISPLMTAFWRKKLTHLTGGKVVASLFNRIPLVHSASILLKPLLYLYWENLDLTGYDLVISSSHSFSSKSVITSPETLHISYIHTPPRYLYTEYNETRALRNPLVKTILSPLLSWLRVKDYIGAQRPDVLIANSKTVRDRIRKYYQRESVVIYPPVNIPKKLFKRQKKYYLCVSRLAKQKGIDLAVNTCTKYSLPLIVVGTGSEEKYLKSLAGPTVKFMGYVPDSKMAEIYAGANALIYCSIDEDFGMVPVEAMAHGVPVVAYDSGAASETIINNKTGFLFNSYDEEDLYKTLLKLQKIKNISTACRSQGLLFNSKNFVARIGNIINRKFTKRE